MPLLKEAMGQVRDNDLKRKVGKGGVRCGRSFPAIPIFCSWPYTSIRTWPN
jgi:hypothetical protein